jgi:Mrp family chromosome partitioning ATPase
MATRERQLDLGPVDKWAEIDSIRDSKFFNEFLNRLVTGRDMHVIVTAASETGVGKTTLAGSLAIILDQQGWTADKAAVANAAEYSRKYDEVEPGSVLILDEAEKAVDARRGMTKESVEVSQAFATKRYQQVFGILTAPSKGWVDQRLGSDSADYWIQALQTDKGRVKGEAKVYRLKNNEHYGTDYTERTEYVHWPNLDWHPEFQKLDKRKVELLESDEEEKYVHKDEVKSRIESVEKETRKETENEMIQRMAENEKLQQKDIAEILDCHPSTVSRRLN